jgi:serine/threonine protein kinase
MKEMSKARIITKRSIKSVMNERQILTQLHNPFIVNMYYAFQDRDNLYLVMDMLSGGDLRYHICKHRRFSEEQTSNSINSINEYRILYRLSRCWA